MKAMSQLPRLRQTPSSANHRETMRHKSLSVSPKPNLESPNNTFVNLISVAKKLRKSSIFVRNDAIMKSDMLPKAGDRQMDTISEEADCASLPVLQSKDIANNPSQRHTIKIRIESNWGHPGFVSCSSIDIIGASRVPIAIKKILVEPIKQSQDELSRLVNGQLMKSLESECWRTNWPPQRPLKTIDLIIVVESKETIDSIRIWPTSAVPSENIRKVSVFLDHHLLFDDELPADFGSIIPLKFFDIDGKCMIKNNTLDVPLEMKDTFGILPFKAIQTLEIDFLKAYRCSDRFGIQRLRIYDQEGKTISLNDENALIEVIGCGEEQTKTGKDIFYDPVEMKNAGQKLSAWEGELTSNSKIIIKFTEPKIITAILFVTLKQVTGPNDIALKQARVKVNGFTIWCGKIQRGSENIDDERSRTNIVFLFDNESVHDLIFEDAYQEPPLTYRPID